MYIYKVSSNVKSQNSFELWTMCIFPPGYTYLDKNVQFLQGVFYVYIYVHRRIYVTKLHCKHKLLVITNNCMVCIQVQMLS